MCELYCQEDAIYVGPDRDQRELVNEADIVALGLLGQYRRDSGWDEWAEGPQYDNQIWKLGPYIQAGGIRSVERVQKRLAEQGRQAATTSGGRPRPGPNSPSEVAPVTRAVFRMVTEAVQAAQSLRRAVAATQD